MVAIVGTRRASAAGLQYARHLAGTLAQQGVAVLSGGADGIDVASHHGALDVGGVTVVVAPSGCEKPFPEHHAALFQRIVASGGVYLSLAAPTRAATRGAFFRRNACLAALCHVLVLVEADFRSGARNASAAARRLGRPVFAVTWPPWHSSGRGCTEEVLLGARPLRSAKDVLKALERQLLHPGPLEPAGKPVPPPTDPEQPATAPDAGAPTQGPVEDSAGVAARPATELAVFRALAAGALHPDEVCARTGLPAAEVQQLLLTLTLEGVLSACAAGTFRLVSR
jgi:DNA processing protein